MPVREQFDQLLARVTDEAGQEFSKLLGEGLQQAEELMRAAEEQGAAETHRIREEGVREAETLKRRVLGTTELAARNKSLELVEELVQRAVERTVARFRTDRQNPRYRQALAKLLEEAVEVVGAPSMIVEANPADQEDVLRLAREVAEKRQQQIHLASEPIESVGGIRVRSADGTVVFDNTVEARIERLKPLLRQRIAALFEEG